MTKNQYRYANVCSALIISAGIFNGGATYAQSDGAQEADQIIVTGVRTFRDDLDSGVTGFELSVKDTPQSVTIASRELLEATLSFSAIDAADYIAGLNVVEPSGGLDTDFRARGFLISQSNGFRQNGFAFQHDFFPDTAVLERIEFIKGVNSIRYGENNPGGFLNYVFKKPQAEQGFELAAFGGLNAFVRVEGDATGQLNESGSIRGRIVAAYEQDNTHIDFGDSDIAVFAPSLAIDLSENVTQEFFGYYQTFSTVPEAGVSVDNAGNIPDIDRNLFTGQPWNSVENDNLSVQSITTWRPEDAVTVQLGAYYTRSDRSRHYARPRNGVFVEDTIILKPSDGVEDTIFVDGGGREYIEVPAGTSAAYDIRRFFDQQERQYGAQVIANYEFSALGREHILAGFIEYEEARVGDGTNASGSRTSTRTFNLFDPDYSIPFNENSIVPAGTSESRNLGMSLQLLLRPLPRLTLLGGVRHDTGKEETLDADGNLLESVGVLFEQDLTETTFSFGGTYAVTDDINVYGTWGQSFTPNTFAFDVNDNLLAPETGRLMEVGVKGEFFDNNLLATLAFYDIERTNVAQEDNIGDPERNLGPFQDGAFIAAGLQKSQGVEFEVVGKITDNWRLSMGYAYTDANIVEDVNAAIVNNGRPNVPEHAFNFFTNYKFDEGSLEGLQLGAGLRYRGERPIANTRTRRFFNGLQRDPLDSSIPFIDPVSGDPVPTFVDVDIPMLEADVVVNLQALYEISDNVSLSVNVQNLLDQLSYESGFSAANTGIRPTPPREVVVGLRGRF